MCRFCALLFGSFRNKTKKEENPNPPLLYSCFLSFIVARLDCLVPKATFRAVSTHIIIIKALHTNMTNLSEQEWCPPHVKIPLRKGKKIKPNLASHSKGVTKYIILSILQFL